MDLKNILQLLVVVIVTLTIGGGLGYYYAPEKVREVEKIVEKEKTTKQEYKKKTKKFDKEGKVTEETEETGTKESKANTQKKEKETEKTKEKKMYAVKVGAVKSISNLDSLTYRVGGELRLPIFNSWLGAEGDIDINDPKVGIYLRLEF